MQLTAETVEDIIQQLVSFEDHPRAARNRIFRKLSELGYSMTSIGGQLQLLMKKLGRNTPRGSK